EAGVHWGTLPCSRCKVRASHGTHRAWGARLVRKGHLPIVNDCRRCYLNGTASHSSTHLGPHAGSAEQRRGPNHFSGSCVIARLRPRLSTSALINGRCVYVTVKASVRHSTVLLALLVFRG